MTTSGDYYQYYYYPNNGASAASYDNTAYGSWCNASCQCYNYPNANYHFNDATICHDNYNYHYGYDFPQYVVSKTQCVNRMRKGFFMIAVWKIVCSSSKRYLPYCFCFESFLRFLFTGVYSLFWTYDAGSEESGSLASSNTSSLALHFRLSDTAEWRRGACFRGIAAAFCRVTCHVIFDHNLCIMGESSVLSLLFLLLYLKFIHLQQQRRKLQTDCLYP